MSKQSDEAWARRIADNSCLHIPEDDTIQCARRTLEDFKSSLKQKIEDWMEDILKSNTGDEVILSDSEIEFIKSEVLTLIDSVEPGNP